MPQVPITVKDLARPEGNYDQTRDWNQFWPYKAISPAQAEGDAPLIFLPTSQLHDLWQEKTYFLVFSIV